MFRKTLITACIAFALLPQSAFAWGKTGHRVTGEIAETYLSPEAKAAIEDILGVEDLAEASTWPDFMRSNPSDYWQRTASPFHYVTVPEGKSYSEVGAPEWGDSVTALAEFKAILLDEAATLEDKQRALRFTVHIIGDLHQPLHVGNGLDQGGNQFRVTFFREMTNLHSVWDTKLVDHEQLSYTEMADRLGRKITDEDVSNWWTSDPLVWIEESAEIRDTIYPTDETRDTLTWGYIYDHRDTMRKRLSQAGVRIAAYMNGLFGS